MDCKEFSNLLDACVDGTLSDAEAERMRAHAGECASCADLLAMRQDLRRMDEELQVPDDFSSSWRSRIEEEARMENNGNNKKKVNWKAWIAVAAALVFVVGGTLINRDSFPRAASRTQGSAAAAKDRDYGAPAGGMLGAYRAAESSAANFAFADMDMEEPMAAYEDMAVPAPEAAEYEADDSAKRQEKIIRTASFTIKTTEYDQDLKQLLDLTESLGGRTELFSSSGDQKSGQTRSASLTLRIPAQRLDEFLQGAGSIGNITAMSQEMQDVSDSYYDVQTRLNTQKEKMNRLQSMMKSAEDMSDLIELESAIADTQYQIDRYMSQLKSYDGRVDYSTVNVSVRETKATEIVTLSLGQRIWSGLQSSLESGGQFLEDMAIFLVAALPWLIVIGLVCFGIRLIVKKRKNHKKQKENA